MTIQPSIVRLTYSVDLGYFGEIGLLSGTPRNATVRATAPSEVLELDAAGFKDRVESSQLTKDRVQASMEERLARAGIKPT